MTWARSETMARRSASRFFPGVALRTAPELVAWAWTAIRISAGEPSPSCVTIAAADIRLARPRHEPAAEASAPPRHGLAQRRVDLALEERAETELDAPDGALSYSSQHARSLSRVDRG